MIFVVPVLESDDGMGHHGVEVVDDPRALRRFTRDVLDDLDRLEGLLEAGDIEADAQRVGAEQELFLVDEDGRPAPLGPEVLGQLPAGERRFTPELARFNLEANLPPRTLDGAFLRHLEDDLNDALDVVRAAAAPAARVVLTGILPSLTRADLGRHNMTPEPRYARLDAAIKALHGDTFHLRIRGLDDLHTTHDSVMPEAANTSLQLHLQISPERFATAYNLAQLISAPMLAAAVNAPVFLGRRLWAETRVALFQQATDDRSSAELDRGRLARVFFGTRWVDRSVSEVFQESAARFGVLFGTEAPPVEPPAGPPPLLALMKHNGTIWRWNRACYGVAGGVAHIRIENRVLPAGPTVIDEVANAALFYGLMAELPEAYGDIRARLSFDQAHANFLAAARDGLGASFDWLDQRRVDARTLLQDELLPIARRGLLRLEVPDDDIERYLGVLEARVRTRQTGSRWLLRALATLEGSGTRQHILQRLTRELADRTEEGAPVHTWPLPTPSHPGEASARAQTVREIMSTDLHTIRPDEALDRAIRVMEWHKIRHLPVEDRDGELVGVVSMAHLPPQMIRRRIDDEPLPVSAAMAPRPPEVEPDTPVGEALDRLVDARGHCLFVVVDGRLRGLVTEQDFLRTLRP